MSRLPGSVLFACSYNSVRSPIAESIAKHFYGNRIFFDSAGVRTEDVNGYAIAVMEEIGIDIRDHSTKTIGDLNDSSFDLIITMTPEAQHQAIELTRTLAVDIEYWPTYDPTVVRGNRDEILDGFRKTRDDLLAKIKNRFGPTDRA
jgi:protein-tyrosine-phosphatase